MSAHHDQLPAGSDPKRVLVTGGAGFIGSHLVDALLERWPDAVIVVVDDLSTGRRSNLDAALERGGERVELIEADVCEAIADLQCRDPFGRIYHLAAAVGVQRVVEDPIACIETNVFSTSALLRYASAHGKPPTLIASSSEVYGKSPSSPFREEDDCLYGPTTSLRWSYACSKAIDEYLALAHQRASELPVVVARLFNTVGPRQVGEYGMVLPRFVRAALAGSPLTVFGDGSQTRCFVDVRDVVPAMIGLLEAGSAPGGSDPHRVFNIGSDEPISISELARLVCEELSSSSEIDFVSFERAMGDGFEDLAQRKPDLNRVRSLIGFEPKISLRKTVQDLADSLRLRPVEDRVGEKR